MKEMKTTTKYLALALVAALICGCSSDDKTVDFATDVDQVSFAETGGEQRIQIFSEDGWVASSDCNWITISPANGRGTTECRFVVDSAKTTEVRRGVVRISNLKNFENREIVVEQKGYPYAINLLSTEPVELSNYAKLEERTFNVTVRSNVDFDVKIPDDASWLKNKSYKLDLNCGVRPREVTISFNWDINTAPRERLAEVQFVPKSDVTLSHSDLLSVKQQAAEPIEEGTRAGDSVALLCISRTLNMLSPIDATEPMSMWNDVVLWEEGMQGYTPDKKGRVRSASFMLFATKEPLPYEVRYLTAAEELSFFGNSNTFLLSLDMGEAITELTQLKRLTVGAYGLTSLPASLKNMKNLVYLNLGSNNFQKVPSILSKENFPNLRSLVMNANQRSSIYDLSNTTRTDIGGLMDEQSFPEQLIKWDLDTLVLSVNYLQGELPTFEEDDQIPCYTQAEIDAVDSLPQFLVDNRIKKVMPSTKLFAINHNRLYGKLPDWLLYHPALDMWFPFSLVFPQEGRAKDGTQSGFDNEPANLNYYYDLYTTKTRPMDEEDYVEE